MTAVKIKDLENTDELDTDEIPACMAKLAEEAGDPREHLPYEALLDFNQQDDVKGQFGEQVDSCKLCQELILIFEVPPE